MPHFISILILLLWFDTEPVISPTYVCTLKAMFKALEHDLKQGGTRAYLTFERTSK